MLPSLIRLIKEIPVPLSVIVRPKASSDLTISTSFGRPNKKQTDIKEKTTKTLTNKIYAVDLNLK